MKGVMLIEVKDGEDGKENPLRTGRLVVVRDEAISKMVKPEELARQIIKSRVAFLPEAVWTTLGLPRDETPKQEQV